MYYNQFLNGYVILKRDLDFFEDTIPDFLIEVEKHSDILLKDYSIVFDLELLKNIQSIEPTDLGEYVYSDSLIERIKTESNVWLNAYLIFNKKEHSKSLDSLVLALHCLMMDVHSTFSIGVHPTYIRRHIIK